MNSRPRGSPLLYIIIITAIGVLVYSFIADQQPETTETPLTDVATEIREGNAKSVTVRGDILYTEL